MAENSGIAWTDSTANFWWGCTKVGPGCDSCYAETWSRRTGGQHWGVGVPRRKIKGTVALLRKLNASGHKFLAENGRPRRVFIQSMSDLFDNEVPVEWFCEAWSLIEACDRLEIQIVTKRISVVEKRLAGVGATAWPKHAGLLVTVCNQEEADRDIPRLLALKARFSIPWVGVSAEPLLGPIDFRNLRTGERTRIDALTGAQAAYSAPGHGGDIGVMLASIPPYALPRDLYGHGLNWIVLGGESGRRARPMQIEWVRSVIEQTRGTATACFVKQMGANPRHGGLDAVTVSTALPIRDRAGADPEEWPADLRVREYPLVP